MAQNKMKLELGYNEATIYRWLVSLNGPSLFTLKDVMNELGLSTGPNGMAHTLSLLGSKGIVKRIGKGVYINQGTGYLPRVIDIIPDVFKALRYYLGLNAAANHWGLSPQIPHLYHILYPPMNQAQVKRIQRWSGMLNKLEDNIGGEIMPVISVIPSNPDIGTSVATVDGVQIKLSTAERTLVDSVIYTETMGGAGEALLWLKTGMNKGISYVDLSRVLEHVYLHYRSVVARFGFLMSLAIEETGAKPESEGFLAKIGKLVSASHATYSWGPQESGTEYFRKWRIHVGRNYMEQLKEATGYE